MMRTICQKVLKQHVKWFSNDCKNASRGIIIAYPEPRGAYKGGPYKKKRVDHSEK